MNTIRRSFGTARGLRYLWTSWNSHNSNMKMTVGNVATMSTLPNTDAKMLAWQIDQYGGIDQFKLVEKPMPIITKPDQILLKVHAASVNPIDCRIRGGYGARLFNRARGVSAAGDELPLTLGRDCSGVIVDMGKNVTGFKEGQEVWATVHAPNQGSHAQYVLVHSNELSPKPQNLTHAEAASIPYVAITVWSATYAVARVRPTNAMDKRVLILGGAGGVGTFATQLLKAWGAHVTVTCSTEAMDFVSTLKPNCIVDYKKDPEAQLAKLGQFDFILDTVGGDSEEYAMKRLNKLKGSQYVTLITPLMRKIDEQGLILGSLSSSLKLFQKAMKASKLGGKYRWSFATPNKTALTEVGKLVEEERIKPFVEAVFPFTELPAAFANIETRSARGKTVISFEKEEKVVPKTADFYMS